ncbi:hypothetical protein BLA29_013544 [Euroglyphus maynei]|uniref:Uncharacterized protein n=1 Tax=Euroglyphus maynei TaxID=6958 RepID=A0A1Y3B856_EURMA|nr:hypothetical protein BLA29_013544 [Euroglyphus maynei]
MKNKNSINQINYNDNSDIILNDNNSMEDYIIHLTEKLKKLQEQVQFLREGQEKNEEKYSTIKKENSSLHNK